MLFKLQELLAVPEDLMAQVDKAFIDQFDNQDPKGWVKVGQDVPSENQVEMLKMFRRSLRKSQEESEGRTLKEIIKIGIEDYKEYYAWNKEQECGDAKRASGLEKVADILSSEKTKRLVVMLKQNPQKFLHELWKYMIGTNDVTDFVLTAEELTCFMSEKEEIRMHRFERKFQQQFKEEAEKREMSEKKRKQKVIEAKKHIEEEQKYEDGEEDGDDEVEDDTTVGKRVHFDHVHKLWEGEAKHLRNIVGFLVIFYVVVGYYVLAKDMPEFPLWDRYYFLSATISTVGFGDM